MSGGSTLLDAPDEDTMVETRARIKDMISMTLGGRAAEEIAFGEITTGAGGGNGSDLERVTRYARAMVQRYGMSERLGPMIFGQKDEMVFLGREISEQRDYSEAVAEIIDEEVRKIVEEAYDRAKQVLAERRDRLDAVSNRLIEVETIDYDEFLQLMGEPVAKGKKLELKPAIARKDAQAGSNSEVPPFGALPNPV
jgi:cell division protease FtsH